MPEESGSDFMPMSSTEGVSNGSVSDAPAPDSETSDPAASSAGTSRDELLLRFKRGDRAALDELFGEEESRLRHHLTARLPRGLVRRVGVSDILQQTAIELIELRERFEARGRPAFRGLVTRLAERALARAVRRERAAKRDIARHDSLGGVVDGVASLGGSTPSQVFVGEEKAAVVQRCFAQLPCGDRLVLRMIDGDGRSYAELARTLEVTEDAARQRRHRALAKLRRLLLTSGVRE